MVNKKYFSPIAVQQISPNSGRNHNLSIHWHNEYSEYTTDELQDEDVRVDISAGSATTPLASSEEKEEFASQLHMKVIKFEKKLDRQATSGPEALTKLRERIKELHDEAENNNHSNENGNEKIREMYEREADDELDRETLERMVVSAQHRNSFNWGEGSGQFPTLRGIEGRWSLLPGVTGAMGRQPQHSIYNQECVRHHV